MIHECDRHTDRQTDRQTSHEGIGRRPRLCIASRGKNGSVVTMVLNKHPVLPWWLYSQTNLPLPQLTYSKWPTMHYITCSINIFKNFLEWHPRQWVTLSGPLSQQPSACPVSHALSASKRNLPPYWKDKAGSPDTQWDNNFTPQSANFMCYLHKQVAAANAWCYLFRSRLPTDNALPSLFTSTFT